MRKMIWTLVILVGVSLTAGLFLITPSAAAQQKVSFRFGHVMPVDHPEHIAAERMKTVIEEKSAGRISMQVFPSAQLGGSRELMTSLVAGSVDMVSTSTFGIIDQQVLIVELPYLFKDFAHVRTFTFSKNAAEVLAGLQKHGVHPFGFWTVGFRNVGNSKRPVTKPEDLKGLLIRAFEHKVLKDTLQALGANVTVLPYAEVYMALMTGTIQGEENPYVNTYTMKFHEVEKFKTETRHMNNFEIVAANAKWWNGLSKGDQQIINEAFADATDRYLKLQEEADAKYKNLLIKAGMQIIEITDHAPWVKAVQPVYATWEKVFGADRIKGIRSLGW